MHEQKKRDHFYVRSLGEAGGAFGQGLWGAGEEREYDLDLEIQTIQQDLNLVKIAREALERVERVLLQMRTLVLEAVDAGDLRRDQIDQEMAALEEAMDKIIASASYNGLNLLDGSMGNIGSIISQIRSGLGA